MARFCALYLTLPALVAATGSALTSAIGSLPFDASVGLNHTSTIQVGIYFEHLFGVNSNANQFAADFYMAYQWYDTRNYASLFTDTSLLDSVPNACSEGTSLRFIEFEATELSLLWKPDLLIANAASLPRVSSERMRLFENGTIEYIQYVQANLGMSDPVYVAFPYDSQHLDITVQSRSLSTNRLLITTLPYINGLHEAHVSNWPGWDYISYEAQLFNSEPDYTLINGCREERFSTYNLRINVKRNADSFLRAVFIPTIMLVVASWSAFFLRHSAVMPRMVTSFITFLAINNWGNSQLSTIPVVSYTVWVSVTRA